MKKFLLPVFIFFIMPLSAIECTDGMPWKLWNTETVVVNFEKNEIDLWEESQSTKGEGYRVTRWTSSYHPDDEISVAAFYIPSSEIKSIQELLVILECEDVKILFLEDQDIIYTYQDKETTSLIRYIFTERAIHRICYSNNGKPHTETEQLEWIKFLQDACILRLMLG
jgi:hypothetical protein